MATTTKSRTSARRDTKDGGGRSRTSGRERASRSSSSERAGSRARSSGGERRVTAKNLNAEDRKVLDRHGSRLSPSTLRAKWIHSPDEREDRPGQTLATRSPDVVKAWADARRAVPATVARRDGDRPRTLRFDFPSNGSSRRLEAIDWDSWLQVFKDRDLVFIYQQQKRDGSESNFFRLDSPDREEG